MSTTKNPEDHVEKLHEAFEGLLCTMFNTISNIQKDAAAPNSGDPQQLKFDQLPQLAEQIVKKTKEIDDIIDRADKDTYIGKDIHEIQTILNQKNESIKNEVDGLDEYCEQANKWLYKINNMLDVIKEYTHPWIQSIDQDPKTHS